MSGLARKVGIVGLLLSVGVACTQLFGGEQNTLAPPSGKTPSINTPTLQPRPTGVAAVCAEGEMRCDGALLQTCADDLTSWVTVQRCAAAALCQKSPAACLSATCGVEEMACSGAVLQKCNADRTGWDLFATCLSPAHCNADLRQCLNEPCAPGTRRCDRSEVDQAPVLEFCRDDRLDWGPLDACVTRELCDQTLTGGTAGGLVVGSDGMVQVAPPASRDTLLTCNLPACNVGEVRCEGARLEFCSEGRTGWVPAEECASAALCAGSLTNRGTPACLPPACGVGQHQCSASGVLQVCSEDRSGFLDLETCIAAPFCNAVLADQDQPGCREAPCEAGVMQCNGAQIQVCRDDRTALDDTGAPCESATLCNADDPLNAVCDSPACRRGATSGNEFQCEGAELQRCNESLTGYDTIQTCVTVALCDASQRANGCKTPACQPGAHDCNGGFLRTCNTDQTAFENTENCGSQAQCDANTGRCADPCEPGATRCNSTNGDLERCADRLTGWQPIADCPNVQLCDEPNGRCDICLGGQFSCADNQLRQCAADGGTFQRQNIGPECAALPNDAGVGVRVCQNNQVVVSPCPNGCSNGRCNECTGNQTRCAGTQVQRCMNGFFAAPASCSDSNTCNGTESCNANTSNCAGSAPPTCNDGNQCTNDTCNPATGCQFSGFSSAAQCVNNNSQTQACANGQVQTTNCSANLGCTGGRCNNCDQGRCPNGNQFQTCVNGQLSAAQNCPANNICQGAGSCVFNCPQLNCNDNNPCTNDSCNAQQGCVRTNNTSSCSDGNACNGNEVCQNGACNNPPDVSCPAPAVCRTSSCNPASGQCATGNQPNNTPCQGGTCQAGTCVPNQVCTPNSATCLGAAARSICNAQGTGTTTQTCTNAAPFCIGAGTCVGCRNGNDCVNSDADPCTADACSPAGTCTHTRITTGACAPPPAPPACGMGDQRCRGTTVERCRADRTGFEDIPICQGTNLTRCLNGVISTADCRDTNPCTGEGCNVEQGCVGTNLSPGTLCNASPFGAGVCGENTFQGVCVQCNSDANCTASAPFCVEHVCSVVRPPR